MTITTTSDSTNLISSSNSISQNAVGEEEKKKWQLHPQLQQQQQTQQPTSGKQQNSNDELQTKNAYWIRTGKQLAAGALSGAIEASFTYPTEYVKVMLQLDGKNGEQKRFKGSIDVIRQTIRTHGLLGMYRGVSVVYCGSVPKYVFRFGAYEQMKPFFVDSNGQLSPQHKLLCGLGAGVCEAFFAVIPQESIKVKFIHDRVSASPQYRGLVHGVRSIVREKGLGGIYQGVAPTLLKQGSNQMIRFFVFDSLKEWWHQGPTTGSNANQHSKLVYPLFGAIAGACSVFGNTPVDVIKTRMQGLESHKYSSTWDCVQQLYRNEGALAFYKGVTPRLVKVSMEVALAFTLYNTLLDLFVKL